MTDTIELRGLTFRVEVEHDDAVGAPWEEHDGHGIIREARGVSGAVSKSPGERVLDVSRHGGARLRRIPVRPYGCTRRLTIKRSPL